MLRTAVLQTFEDVSATFRLQRKHRREISSLISFRIGTVHDVFHYSNKMTDTQLFYVYTVFESLLPSLSDTLDDNLAQMRKRKSITNSNNGCNDDNLHDGSSESTEQWSRVSTKL